MAELLRAAWVDVDLGALRANVAALTELIAPSEVCAVVKADGYGHGDVEVARVAVAGGATRLAVALVEEGRRLRHAGIQVPILILSEPRLEAMDAVVANNLTPAIYSEAALFALSAAVKKRNYEQFPVHVKVDTGMHRVGVATDRAVALMQRVQDHPELSLEGVFTHFAVADEPTNEFTVTQGERFIKVLKDAADVGIVAPLVHAANSAGALLHPEYRFSLARFGIAIYGVACSDLVPLAEGSTPVMAVKASVSFSKQIDADEAVSYGQRYRVNKPTWIATVPVGYADGIPRSLGANGGEVLIGGRRRPIAGTVTMDQITVDCGDDEVEVGEEVVLIGQQGDERITAEEWAEKTGTIGYEITCRIGPRLPRRYHSEQ